MMQTTAVPLHGANFITAFAVHYMATLLPPSGVEALQIDLAKKG